MSGVLCRKYQAGVCHCERSEAISNVTIAFSAYNAGDCHGPSGLAMTECGAFLQSMSGAILACTGEKRL